jgi:hypothetical protein
MQGTQPTAVLGATPVRGRLLALGLAGETTQDTHTKATNAAEGPLDRRGGVQPAAARRGGGGA